MTKERYAELVQLAHEVLTKEADFTNEYSPYWDTLVEMSELVMELHKSIQATKKR